MDRPSSTVAIGTARAIHGQVVGADKSPLAGARVALTTAPPPPDEPPRITYTDRGGRFRFDAAPPGPLLVMAEAGSQGLGSAAVGAESDAAVSIAMRAEPAIGGRVVDETGKPVPGAWLTIVKHGTSGVGAGEVPGPALSSTALCAFTDADGRFRFGGLPGEDDWTLLCNYLRGGAYCGGGLSVATGQTAVEVPTRVLSR